MLPHAYIRLWKRRKLNARPSSSASTLLHEIRDREESAESSARMILRNATYVMPTTSGNNSRYMQFFLFYVLTPLVAAGSLGALVAWVISLSHR